MDPGARPSAGQQRLNDEGRGPSRWDDARRRLVTGLARPLGLGRGSARAPAVLRRAGDPARRAGARRLRLSLRHVLPQAHRLAQRLRGTALLAPDLSPALLLA